MSELKGADIVVWLGRMRDDAATLRQGYFAEIQKRDDGVKEGRLLVEDVAAPNREDLVEATKQDLIARQLFTALEEIQRSRKIIAEMTKALRDRGHYCPDEPPGR